MARWRSRNLVSHPLGGAETYFYQNHPVILELIGAIERMEINFVGTVATIASANNFDRERNTRFSANLVKWALQSRCCSADKIRRRRATHRFIRKQRGYLECDGIKTAVQVTDLARDHRVESALLFNFPEVNAIVCVGGNSTNWTLPPVERVIAANSGLSRTCLPDRSKLNR